MCLLLFIVYVIIEIENKGGGQVPQYVFFIGGYDLEMITIRDLVASTGTGFYDAKLAWGAKASDYRTVIELAHNDKRTPVLVELEVDFKLPASAIVIDHHGNRSGEEASIIQTIKLLDLMPTREHLLIAANDSGYIPAMQAMGATQAEIDDIRRRDRQAQGVEDWMERDAERAIKEATEEMGMRVVRLPHNKFSVMTDRLFNTWPDGKQNLLVICWVIGAVTEYYYFGRGDLCKALKEAYAPDSWGGGQGYGNPEGQAFAGCRTNDYDAIRSFFENQ